MRERPQKQNLGEQAARFSLYVPVAVVMLGFCVSTMMQRERSTILAIAYFNLVLMVLGFLAGVIALVAMRKFGREGILYRAVGGVILNGLLLASVYAMLRPLLQARAMQEDLVGVWTLIRSPVETQTGSQLDLQKDGRFRFVTNTHIDAPPTVSGKWVLTTDRTLGLDVQQVENGNNEMAGQKIGLGKVRSVQKTKMVLETDKGDEIFERR